MAHANAMHACRMNERVRTRTLHVDLGNWNLRNPHSIGKLNYTFIHPALDFPFVLFSTPLVSKGLADEQCIRLL